MVLTVQTTAGAAQRLMDYDRDQSKTPSLTPYMPWGFPELDKLTNGIRLKEMTILLGRAGSGKSALAGLYALNAAGWLRAKGIKKDVRVITLEVDTETWLMRLACFRAMIPVNDVVTGFRSQDQADRYYEELEKLAKLNIEFIDSAPNGLSDIEAFVKRNSLDPSAKNSNCALWIVDHIGLVHAGTDRFGSIDAASDFFRELSKEVAPSLVLSQMNRGSDMRQDKRPTTSDVYGSEKVVQNARKIFAIYREDMSMKLEEEERKKPLKAELIILKNNNGQMGTVDMWFHGPSLNWYEA